MSFLGKLKSLKVKEGLSRIIKRLKIHRNYIIFGVATGLGAGACANMAVNALTKNSSEPSSVVQSGYSQLDGNLKALEILGAELEDFPKFGTIDDEPILISFSLVNCFNHEVGLSDKSKFILKDKTIPTGIIVTPKNDTTSNAYLEIDYIKTIINDYAVEYPVCLNIDAICSESGKSAEEIQSLIEIYAKKLKANGCMIVLIGHEENMKKIRNFLNYDKGLILDDVNEEVEGKYDFVIIDGVAYSSKDYEAIIKNNNLQNQASFVGDLIYVVAEGDTLTEIGARFGISVLDLQKYNNLCDANGNYTDLIHPGQELIIPSVYGDYTIEYNNGNQTETSTTNTEENGIPGTVIETENRLTMPENKEMVKNEVDPYKYYKGIDVSEYQGKIDWETARKKIDFAILRVADAYNRDANGNIMLDKCFIYNIEECNRLGIPVGVYIYSRADDEEKLNEEIRFVLKVIEPYNITLSVYRDLEGPRAEALASSESERKNQVSLTDKFCSTMEAAGYPSGVYLHKKYLSYVSELGNKYSIWAQGGYYYATDCDFDDMRYAMESPSRQFELTYTVNIFQSTQNGLARELGIPADYVDFNYAERGFIDALINKFDKQGNVYVLKRDN